MGFVLNMDLVWMFFLRTKPARTECQAITVPTSKSKKTLPTEKFAAGADHDQMGKFHHSRRQWRFFCNPGDGLDLRPGLRRDESAEPDLGDSGLPTVVEHL